jgi:hypothetical protein
VDVFESRSGFGAVTNHKHVIPIPTTEVEEIAMCNMLGNGEHGSDRFQQSWGNHLIGAKTKTRGVLNAEAIHQ